MKVILKSLYPYHLYKTGVLTIHATHRDLLLFFFFLQKVHFPVIMYNFPSKNAHYHINICTVSQLKKNN